MRIVLNLLPLKTGGGVQVALDFLSHLASRPDAHEWHAVARAGMPFLEPRFRAGLASLVVVPDRLRARIAFELWGGRRLAARLGADVVYTLFGPHWAALPCPAVGGCAYSNLLYPEIDFRADEPALVRPVYRLRDSYRRRSLMQADGTIFETEELAGRAVRLLKLAPERVTCVRPKASALVDPQARHPPTAALLAGLPERFHVLALCGYHPNKRLHLIPEVLRILRARGESGIGFITTLADSPGAAAIFRQAERYGVRDLIFNLGTVPQAGCVELYRRSQAVVLASQLESFSNTIAEAWIQSVPLLASDLAWARSICGDAAEYFRFDDAGDLADRIVGLRAATAHVRQLTAAGQAALADFPDSAARHRQIVAFIERIVALSPKPRKLQTT